MVENNQYGNAMTKLLPTGCIRKMKKTLTMREFQLILEGVLREYKIGHLFIVDIEINFERSTPKELLFNEFYTPIFEKKKILSPSERSVFQLLDTMLLNNQGLLNSYTATAKTHCTMDKKYLFHSMLNI